jgi:2'-deoxynucleoside 5'-phosphate N-hydrolase
MLRRRPRLGSESAFGKVKRQEKPVVISIRKPIMNAYLGIKFHADNRNRDVIEMLSQVLATCGLITVCIRRDIERWGAVELSPQELMETTFDVMRSCQLAVIDLTEKGVGLGIEAGYVYACGISVVTIARSGSDISTTLRGISQAHCFYDRPADLKTFFATFCGSSELMIQS